MTAGNPTPSQVLTALRDHGVDVKTVDGWDRVGRSWRGPDGSPGMTGCVNHHTATRSATGKSGAPSLYWALNAYDRPACNMVIGRGPGDTHLLAAGSVYHCGDGGPVPKLSIPSRGFFGQTRLWGNEFDDPGLGPTLTDYQIDNGGRINAALVDLNGWEIDDAIGTHKCYTDGCHGWSSSGPLATVGRKNDTMDGPWRSWPGINVPQPYNAPFWRAEARKHLVAVAPQTWDGTVPSRAAIRRAEAGENNRAGWRVACRLHDLGFRPVPAKPPGKQNYPRASVIRFQMDMGWKDPHGSMSQRTMRRLFGKVKP